MLAVEHADKCRLCGISWEQQYWWEDSLDLAYISSCVV